MPSGQPEAYTQSTFENACHNYGFSYISKSGIDIAVKITRGNKLALMHN